ncbi:MAG: leucyl/phenylalanyl-tRNA--protein transferase [Ignavibacteriaceae bacterium]|nr:leucyl/phenylalanyl-tRNA--protein transferase [Ignavibacteriaceae bacterium]
MSEKSINNKELLLPDNMLRMYAAGAFPMAEDRNGQVSWYLPDVRTIIPLDGYNIPRSLKKFLESSDFEYKTDTDFLSVVNNCADREATWISEELIEAYLRLYKRKHIHTVEVWQKGKFVGGLYGVSFRGAFFGESMFSKIPQASKAALAYLLQHLTDKDFVILDVQYMTPHLKMFGAIEIPFNKYQDLLNAAYLRNCEF